MLNILRNRILLKPSSRFTEFWHFGIHSCGEACAWRDAGSLAQNAGKEEQLLKLVLLTTEVMHLLTYFCSEHSFSIPSSPKPSNMFEPGSIMTVSCTFPRLAWTRLPNHIVRSRDMVIPLCTSPFPRSPPSYAWTLRSHIPTADSAEFLFSIKSSSSLVFLKSSVQYPSSLPFVSVSFSAYRLFCCLKMLFIDMALYVKLPLPTLGYVLNIKSSIQCLSQTLISLLYNLKN